MFSRVLHGRIGGSSPVDFLVALLIVRWKVVLALAAAVLLAATAVERVRVPQSRSLRVLCLPLPQDFGEHREVPFQPLMRLSKQRDVRSIIGRTPRVNGLCFLYFL